jgi:superfamily II DNA/RNA helicase
MPTREELATQYLDQLPYPPYPVQEEALLAWFTAEQGVLVCAPTGTGKTLIAQAALYEALHTGTTAYYTTPLIALTEQKFREMTELAVQWGFPPESVGLVTGNRRVNPEARILIVVAEILLNRLLNPEAFDFAGVSAVVMDEFHNFADIERGIVWELSLAMLPKHVRLMLLSATVGNAGEFLAWLDRSHGRKLELVESKERKVPLTFRWVADEFLGDQLVKMAQGEGEARTTPALVFCFNRDECWSVAEHLKGLDLLPGTTRVELNKVMDKYEWPHGVGPKLKQILRRGVGVHHAGLLPKYRRVVEELFQKKLLAVCICTETLAAGINLPARSVVVTTLMKGPHGKQRLIEASTAHQIFGRAGRPQFDDKGYVFAIAHEDDVRLLRWREKYDQIPESTKNPTLLKAKKALLKKKPTKSDKIQYWTEPQFKQLQAAPPGKLYSKGPIPWRLLAYLLKLSPEVSHVREVLRKRLMDTTRVKSNENLLDRMLLTLAAHGYVVLDPPPPPEDAPERKDYVVQRAQATEKLDRLLVFRSVHPLYGAYLLDHLGIASRAERLQAFESVLEIPRPLLRHVRVPMPDRLPPGPLEERLSPELVQRGLIAAPLPPGEEEEDDDAPPWQRPTPELAEKLRMYFEALYPDVTDINVLPVWSAAEMLLEFSGNFNLYIRSRDLVKQEGIIFRHLLRLVLLCAEFAELTPAETTSEDWQRDLREIMAALTASCREVDPTSTDQAIQRAHAQDVVEGEEAIHHPVAVPDVAAEPPKEEEPAREFGADLFDA